MRRFVTWRIGLVTTLVIGGTLAIGLATSSASPSQAVWPTAASGVTYATPSAAARGLALDLLGMETPVVSPYRGTASSGIVTLRPGAVGGATIVSVVRTATGWLATGSAFVNVTVTTPRSGDHVTTIVTLAGRSTAFEGVVNYSIRTDAGRVVARGTVMGGSNGVVAAFRTSVHIPRTTGSGEVVLLTRSARDGSALGATIVRVNF